MRWLWLGVIISFLVFFATTSFAQQEEECRILRMSRAFAPPYWTKYYNLCYNEGFVLIPYEVPE